MKAYKGFNSDMTCKGFQYEEGKTYETDSAVLCEKGFHACENPLEVFKYYPPCDENGNLNKFHEVELEDVSNERGDDSKVVGKKIKIGKELNFNDITKAHIGWAKNNIDKNNKSVNSGDCSIAMDSGESSIAVNSGYRSSAVNSGEYSTAVNSGDRSTAVNSGDRSTAVNSGNCSSAVNSGYKSSAVNSGYKSSAVNSGYKSIAVNSGDCSTAVNSGKDSIAVAWGENSIAKAEKGSYIVLTEWVIDEKNIELILKNAKMAYVDGEKIKANTFYKLKNGKFVEVK